MTENVQNVGLFVCNALLDAAKSLFRHLPALPVAQRGILAICLTIGSMGACGESSLQKIKENKEEKSAIEVKNVVIDPEGESISIGRKSLNITMTKEVSGIKVDSQPATGVGKDWSIKLERLDLEDKVTTFSFSTDPSARFYGASTIQITIEWTNKDGITGSSNIIGSAIIEEMYKNGAMERKLISVSLISL